MDPNQGYVKVMQSLSVTSPSLTKYYFHASQGLYTCSCKIVILNGQLHIECYPLLKPPSSEAGGGAT